MDGEDSPCYSGGGGDADSEVPEEDKESQTTRRSRPRTANPSRGRQNHNRNNANITNQDGIRFPHTDPHAAGCSTYDDPNLPSTSTGRPYINRPTERRTFAEQVTRDEMLVGEQARLLLNMFLQERAQTEQNPFEPRIRDLCRADKVATAGLTDESLHDIASTLRRIGDDMSRDATLNDFIEKVPVRSTKEVFMKVCLQMFEDGNFNWGRIVALFYFAYRLCVRSFMRGLDNMPWVKELLRWVVDFIVQHVAKWIISRGGWCMIKEWFGISDTTMAVLTVSSALLFFWSIFKK
uniref:Apoptosis regulator BAX-like n=1 Tax=Phallusia mammillata TaxID=59560 RepID=A0A6F9D6Q2_9ASCI|nr:apoptosis regulator BAX-like [Phallusia mammillata]